MSLIERYLHEVGRLLPAKKRDDILSELRSVLEDSLEARVGENPTEADVAAVIKEMGPPRDVAAGYHPANQYLIGPELFPLFKLVVWIVLLASIGGQLIAVMVSVTFGEATFAPLQTLTGLVNSMPVSIGSVVIVFYLLQRFEVKPDIIEEAFDPHKLPHIEDQEPIKRGEQIVSIVLSVIFFIVFAWFANQGYYGWSNIDGFFFDPVLDEYFFWIALSILAGIILSIVLLWRGRWQTSTRIANILVNLFSLGVLFKLIQEHRALLMGMGYSGNFSAIARISEMITEGTQPIGLWGVQMGLTVAAVVVSIETIFLIIRLVMRLSSGPRVFKVDLTASK